MSFSIPSRPSAPAVAVSGSVTSNGVQGAQPTQATESPGGPSTLEGLLASSYSVISDPKARLTLVPSSSAVPPPTEPQERQQPLTQASRDRSASLTNMAPLSAQTTSDVRDRSATLATPMAPFSIPAREPPPVAKNPDEEKPLAMSAFAAPVATSPAVAPVPPSAATSEPVSVAEPFQPPRDAPLRNRSATTVGSSETGSVLGAHPGRSASVSGASDDRARTFSGGFNFASLTKTEEQRKASAAPQDRRATWHEPPEFAQPPPAPTPAMPDSMVQRDRSKSLSNSSSGGSLATPTAEGQLETAASTKPSVLDKIAETPINPMELAMKSMQQQSGASLRMASPAALIAQQAQLQQSRPKTLQEMNDTEIKAIYDEILLEVEKEEDELKALHKQRETIEDQVRAELKREEEMFKSEKQRFEKEIIEADGMVEQYMKRVGQLDKELRDKELECDEENWKLYLVKESRLENQYLEESLTAELEMMRSELAAREENSRRVQQGLDVARISNRHNNRYFARSFLLFRLVSYTFRQLA